MRAARSTFSSLAAMSVTLVALGAQPGGSTEPRPPSSSAAPAASARESGFSIVAALDELPVELVDEAPLVSMADLDAVTAANGMTRPDATDVDGYTTWMHTITGLSLTDPREAEPEYAPVVAYPPVDSARNSRLVAEVADAVGFTLADVSWFADVTHLPGAFTVFAGPFDESTLSPDLVDVGNGIVSLGEGDDFYQDLTAPTALSILGTPQRLAQRDGQIALSPDTALVENWLHGDETGDRHDAAIVAVAAALDDAGAVSAVLAELGDLEDSLGPASPEQRAALVDHLGDTALDDSFDDEVGIGWHAADGESVITIVYSLDDDADAEGAVEQVRRLFEAGESIQTGAPLAALLVVDDVTTDGSVVVATLSLGPDGMPWAPVGMLSRMDLPFVTLD